MFPLFAALRPRLLALLLAVAMAGGLVSCLPEQAVIVDIDPGPTQLVIESYLTPGAPLRVGVMRTLPFFGSLDTSALFVTNALVTIRHQDWTDTLTYRAPFTSQTQFVFGEYRSDRPAPANYTDPFFLTVTLPLVDPTTGDTTVLQATGETTLLPPVPLDTAYYELNPNDTDEIRFRAEWSDPEPDAINYYRFVLTNDATDDNRLESRNGQLDESNFQGPARAVTTGFDERLEWGDSVVFRFYHIHKAFYDYYNSVRAANRGNLSPFANPAQILSNVQGGIGIFTGAGLNTRVVQLPPYPTAP